MMNRFVKDMTIVAALLVLPTVVFAQTHYTPVEKASTSRT